MIFITFQSAKIVVSIRIDDTAINQISIKQAFLCWLFCIFHSNSSSPSGLKFSLVNLLLEDLSAMKVLESISKLADILWSIWNEHSVAMDQAVLPLANVFNSMLIFLLCCLQVVKLGAIWSWAKDIIRQGQVVIKLKVKFLQSLNTLRVTSRPFFVKRSLDCQGALLLMDNCAVDKFVVKDLLHVLLLMSVRTGGVMQFADGGSVYSIALG